MFFFGVVRKNILFTSEATLAGNDERDSCSSSQKALCGGKAPAQDQSSRMLHTDLVAYATNFAQKIYCTCIFYFVNFLRNASDVNILTFSRRLRLSNAKNRCQLVLTRNGETTTFCREHKRSHPLLNLTQFSQHLFQFISGCWRWNMCRGHERERDEMRARWRTAKSAFFSS